VRQLQFDARMVEVLLLQDRGGNASEPVTGHAAQAAHALERAQDRVVAHGLLVTPLARETP
jgi:hypothetical protein